MEIVKLIGSDVLPDDQKLTLEIARVIRLGFLQQNAFHPDDTCVSLEKQFKMMEVILYLYKKCRALIAMGLSLIHIFFLYIMDYITAIFNGIFCPRYISQSHSIFLPFQFFYKSITDTISPVKDTINPVVFFWK